MTIFNSYLYSLPEGNLAMENILIFDETNHRLMAIFSLPRVWLASCQLNKSELLNNLTMKMHQHEEWIIKGNNKVE